MSQEKYRWLVAIITYTLPILALTIGGLCAGQAIGVLFSFAEHMLLVLLMACIVFALRANQHGMTVSILASAVIGTVAMNHPIHEAVPRPDGPEWLRTLKGCAILSQPIKAPVRLIMWTLDDDRSIDDDLSAIIDLRPDIIIFNGSASINVGGQLSDELSGEVKFFTPVPSSDGLTAVVRGSFQYCGEENDTWTIPLATDSNTDGQAVITFPLIEEVGVFPLVITSFADRPPIGDWLTWAQIVMDSAQDTANGVSNIGARKMVLMGDFQVPHHSPSLSNPLTQAGLRSATSGPNWPASILGVPFLTQHALDQAWVGNGWTIQAARALPIGNQSRYPVLVDLAPRTRP